MHLKKKQPQVEQPMIACHLNCCKQVAGSTGAAATGSSGTAGLSTGAATSAAGAGGVSEDSVEGVS